MALEHASQPRHIEVRGARVHNLKHVNVDVPLNELVAIAGVSGSGKSSLAMGTIYAEGSRRYIEALSTFTRRRMEHAARADVDAVVHVPAALALRQRPGVPGVRSTFGTSTELLNVVRLMFSRLASHVCANGHRLDPSIDVAAEEPMACDTCGEPVHPPEAEDLAFNSGGACPSCDGTGVIRTVDDASLVPDESKTLDEGAVVPWNMFGWHVQPDIAREFGVRTDVPYRDLEPWEKEIVLAGPEEKRNITLTTLKDVRHIDFTFRNARLTVLKELKRAKDEKRLARVSRFLTESECPQCGGSRLSEAARAPRVRDSDGGFLNLAEATALTLEELVEWAPKVVEPLPRSMHAMSESLVAQLLSMAERLTALGLAYLTLDRAGGTLSTGERQRVQLARAVRNRTTGVLYVLDEPSIGLHPSNVEGLLGLIADLLGDGNSVLLVDHDVQVLRQADTLIEIGPGSGQAGGTVIAQGDVEEIEADPESVIGPFLAGYESVVVRERASTQEMFDHGAIAMHTTALHTVHPLDITIPRARLVAVTGASGSGKTTMALESLVPGLRAVLRNRPLPAHVRRIDPGGITHVHVIDATPIGVNIRSTVATYSGVHDDLRRAFARTGDARTRGLMASDFSYNTGSLRCPRCDGTGRVELDIQFLPDIDIDCPVCHGSRYRQEASDIRRPVPGDDGDTVSLPQLMGMTVESAMAQVDDISTVRRHLRALVDLGLGYLTLGEDTPALSGGEAQRLKLGSDIDRDQAGALFVFDEPSVGLHPKDVRTLVAVLNRLVEHGATVIVIEHDLDMVANADWIIDMGPGGGAAGGRVIGEGTPQQLARNEDSATGRFLRRHLEHGT